MRPIARAALVLGLAAAAAEAREVSGVLHLPAPVAEAVVAVDLTDAAGAVVAGLRATAEAAGDLKVRLEAPEGAVMLHAAVLSGGVPVLAAPPVPLPEGASPADLGSLALAPARPPDLPVRYRCGAVPAEVLFAGDRARLRIGGAYAELTADPAASGARYRAAEDEGTFVWTRGEAAIIALRGRELPECRTTVVGAAEPFVARGTEPFWLLTLGGGMARYQPMDGAAVEGPLPAAEAEGPRLIYRIGADLTVTVEATLSHNQMSGMPHPATVTVTVGGQTLNGTGGEPRDLIEGIPWRITEVAGRPVPEGAEVTLQIAGDRATGRAGCNRYSGEARLTGGDLTFGPMAATRMACAPALMALEGAVFGALARVYAFDFDAEGRLLLTGPDGTPLLKALP